MAEPQERLGSAVALIDIVRDYSIEQASIIDYLFVHVAGIREWVVPLKVPYNLESLIKGLEELTVILKCERQQELVRIDV